MATTKRLDPIRTAALATRAGDLVPRCARKQKHIALSGRVSVQAVSQWRGGATYGPFWDAVEAADRLGRLLADEKTDPFPAIVEMEAVVMEASLSHWSTEDLVREWKRLWRAESQAEGRENEESQNFVFARDLRALAEAHKHEAAIQVRFAAVCELLASRGVDPLDSVWGRLDG